MSQGGLRHMIIIMGIGKPHRSNQELITRVKNHMNARHQS